MVVVALIMQIIGTLIIRKLVDVEYRDPWTSNSYSRSSSFSLALPSCQRRSQRS